jgi:hypothetical protein
MSKTLAAARSAVKRRRRAGVTITTSAGRPPTSLDVPSAAENPELPGIGTAVLKVGLLGQPLAVLWFVAPSQMESDVTAAVAQ